MTWQRHQTPPLSRSFWPVLCMIGICFRFIRIFPSKWKVWTAVDRNSQAFAKSGQLGASKKSIAEEQENDYMHHAENLFCMHAIYTYFDSRPSRDRLEIDKYSDHA